MGTIRHRRESLGRMATFLMPSLKLKTRLADGTTVEEYLHTVLMQSFGGYTAGSATLFGFWRSDDGRDFYGEHREYKVAFEGKERIKELEVVIAAIARSVGEQCIYLETGEDAWLIFAEEHTLEAV